MSVYYELYTRINNAVCHVHDMILLLRESETSLLL